MIRDGINLTRIPDSTLKALTAKLLEAPKVRQQYFHLLRFAQNVTRSRQAVFDCSLAIDAWELANTVTTVTAPSPESLAWSNLEGGHVHHESPSFAKFFESFTHATK